MITIRSLLNGSKMNNTMEISEIIKGLNLLQNFLSSCSEKDILTISDAHFISFLKQAVPDVLKMIGTLEFKEKTQKAKQDNCIKRSREFYNSLIPYIKTYDKKMIRSFYDYWSEPNRSKTRMRFELEPTFDLSRRLRTWENHDLKSKPSSTILHDNNINKFNNQESW